MSLTPQKRAECLDLLGAGETVYNGQRYTRAMKVETADWVIAAFDELVAESPDVKPSRAQVRQRARAKYGSIILLAILMGLVSWVTKKILDWLWDNYTAPYSEA